jgi:hypothetical protein
MLRFILDLVTAVRVFIVCRTNLALEILALRQQAAVLKRNRPRPKLSRMDRLFWTALRQCLVPLGRGTADREAGDRGELASRRISFVLALAVSRTSPWQSNNHRRNPRTHPQDGTGESFLGRAQNPRRAG